MSRKRYSHKDYFFITFPKAKGKRYRKKVYHFNLLSDSSSRLLRTYKNKGHGYYAQAKFK